MKGPLTMLACLVTVLTTWMSLTLLGWAFSDSTTSFKACATHDGTFIIMFIFGWIPAIIVGNDIDTYFKNKNY